MRLTSVIVCALVYLCVRGDARGQEAVRSADARFRSGAWEFENMLGTYFLFDRGGNERVTVDYTINSTRLGIMLTNPHFTGALRGNVEVLGELFAGSIFHGPGDVVAGGTIFFRYNFIQPGAGLVPYLQGGGGFVYSDIEEGAASSNAVSQSVNFNLQFIGGLRFIVNPKWSIHAELGYRHISNAGMSDPNYGIDQLGGALGAGFSF